MSFLSLRSVLLCLPLLLPGFQAMAEEGARDAGESVVPMPPPVADCIRRDEQGRFTGWVESQHCLLSGQATAAAQWLDGLLAGGGGSEEARWQVRSIAYQQWDEELGWRSGVSFRSTIELPNARRRLKLVLSDEEDRLNQNPGLTATRAGASAALRWLPAWNSRVKYTFDVGVRSRPEVYTRLGARRDWRISDDALATLAQTLDYGGRVHGRSLTALTLDRAVDGVAVLRLVTTLQYREQEPQPVGFRWGQDWLVLHKLGRQQSLTYGLTFDGVQQPDRAIESRGVFLLYRRSCWQPWLFVELEPHLTRYRSLRWDAVPSVVLRLEAQFGR